MPCAATGAAQNKTATLEAMAVPARRHLSKPLRSLTLLNTALLPHQCELSPTCPATRSLINLALKIKSEILLFPRSKNLSIRESLSFALGMAWQGPAMTSTNCLTRLQIYVFWKAGSPIENEQRNVACAPH